MVCACPGAMVCVVISRITPFPSLRVRPPLPSSCLPSIQCLVILELPSWEPTILFWSPSFVSDKVVFTTTSCPFINNRVHLPFWFLCPFCCDNWPWPWQLTAREQLGVIGLVSLEGAGVEPWGCLSRVGQ